MKRKFLELYRRHKEIANYLIIGGLTTLISLVIKYSLLFTILDAKNEIQLQIAVVISWIVSVAFAYWTNRKYVFESKNANYLKEAGLFVSSRISTLLLDMLILWFFVTLLKLNSDTWVIFWTIISQAIVIVANYILSKFIVFKKKSSCYNNEVSKKKSKTGFTIIEVVLVLAIAGLVFLMVFIALPALQRSQRNTQRREDLSRIQAAIQDWQKHNPNLAITDKYDDRFASNGFCSFYNRYLSDLKDPSTGRAYRAALWLTYNVVDCTDDSTVSYASEYDREGAGGARFAVMGSPGEIQFNTTAKCDGENFIDVNLYSKAYAIRMYLEGGAIACVDSGMIIQ